MRPVEIYQNPPMHPWQCMKCKSGAGTREFFVDLGFDVEWEGNVYLCNECMTNLGKTSKLFITQEDHHNAIAMMDQELQRLHDFEDKFAEWALVFHQVYQSSFLEEFLTTLKAIKDGRREPIGTVNQSSNVVDSDSTITSSDDSGPDPTIEPPILPITPTFA